MTNTATALAGFLFASQWHIDWPLLWHFMIGLTLVIASACVLNNYIDRDLDKKMERTKKRALPEGTVSGISSVIFGSVLGVTGFWVLTYTNSLTLLVVVSAYIDYVAIYTWAKRHTVHSTLIGTIPGAASLVAGYTAVTNRLDATALILFLIMLSWQMVHFYAISLYRLKDYQAAGMPIMPTVIGVSATKMQMVIYLIALAVSSILLTIAGGAGFIYLIAAGMLVLYWLWKVLSTYSSADSTKWGHDVFKFSLVVVVILSLLISLGSILP